jgi:hypothetical protein
LPAKPGAVNPMQQRATYNFADCRHNATPLCWSRYPHL